MEGGNLDDVNFEDQSLPDVCVIKSRSAAVDGRSKAREVEIETEEQYYRDQHTATRRRMTDATVQADPITMANEEEEEDDDEYDDDEEEDEEEDEEGEERKVRPPKK